MNDGLIRFIVFDTVRHRVHEACVRPGTYDTPEKYCAYWNETYGRRDYLVMIDGDNYQPELDLPLEKPLDEETKS